MKNLQYLLIGIVFSISIQSEEAQHLLGFPPFFSSQEIQIQFTPLMKYLAKQTGVTLQMKVAKDYGELIEWLEKGQLSFAHLSPYAYVKAKERFGLVLLATVANEGETTFRGLIITHSKNPISTLSDLANRSFAYVDTKSTSGFIYPRALLIKNGYNPSHFLGKTSFLGDHLAVIDAILTQKYEAGATYDGALVIAKRKGYKVNELKILAKTEPIAHDAYVALPSVDANLRKRFQQALLQLNTESEPGKSILGKIGWIGGWKQGEEERYEPLRDLIHYGRERPRLGILPVTLVGERLSETKRREVMEIWMAALTKTQRFFIVSLEQTGWEGQENGTFTTDKAIAVCRLKNVDFLGELIWLKNLEKLSLSLRFYECKKGSLQQVYVAEGKGEELKEMTEQIVRKLAITQPLRGTITEIKPPHFTIDLGQLQGAEAGDVVEIYSHGEAICNPVTSEIVGYREKIFAKGKVITVSMDTALCQPEQENNVPLGMEIKLYAKPTAPELKIVPQENKIGSLKVISEPLGAQIWLDGKQTGFRTPHIFEKVPSKSYVVSLSLSYYKNGQSIVNVLPKEEATTSISLVPFHKTEFTLWIWIGTGILFLSLGGLWLWNWRAKRRKTEDRVFFGRYRILAEIGRGGMGRVYKAYDASLNRVVAIKVLIAGEAAVQVEAQRFVKEARASAQLCHPNIVTLYDIGTEGKQTYLVMEFIEGISLKTLRQRAPLSIRQTVEIMRKVGTAVSYAHSQGIIHCDLKPANIMIDPFNEPKIMDFGLAKMMQETSELTKSGVILGTPLYMPPEQARGRRDIDYRSDVYALGAILYELLTDSPLFSGGCMEILEKIFADDPIPPSQIKPDIPKDLENICLKALEKEKERRYQSAAKFVDDLAGIGSSF
jgi:phosphate/phosphite/phosphonate ABC transporter binding protein